MNLKQYETLCLWIKQNTGKVFSLNGEKAFYICSKGYRRKLEKAPFNSKEKFIEAVKEYIKANYSATSDVPQVIFSNDYSKIKIYLNGDNFWNDSK